MTEEIEIPLFPLNVVLFPYSKIPLYIFEERYKKLINDCMNNEAVFGINLFADKKIFTIGCTAKIDELVSRSETGEMNIVAIGVQRFRINSYSLSPFGYYNGLTELIEESNEEIDRSVAEKAVELYNELVNIVYKGTVKTIDLNDIKWHGGERSVSFAMAEKSGMSLIQKQTLLEIDDENGRMNFILKYFEEVIPGLSEKERISGIIKSDGYIQQ